MASITFRGDTIWDDGSNGEAFDFSPGVRHQQAIVSEATIGTGHWIKQGNVTPAIHVLVLDWFTSDPEDIPELIEALAEDAASELGTLSVPVFGTYSGCMMDPPGQFKVEKVEGGYHIHGVLTFRQFP
jgi:hypothetical protein